MGIKKEAEGLLKKVDKADIKDAVNKALNSDAADKVIEKVNEKTKNIDINKEDIKNAVNSALK